MATYKVIFKPVEPYFFGNEKNFVYPGQKINSAYSSSYFIKSEKTPSQSTILGALRYIFLPYKWEDGGFDDSTKREANEKAVGEKSFNVNETKQEFGLIKNISPVFICGKNSFGENVTLIPTPMDHNRAKKISERKHKITKEDILKYSPFEAYIETKTSEDEKLYADDFDVKKGIENSYVSIQNGEIFSESDLFETDLRIGINRSNKKDGFFKKEYRMLKDGFAFAVYADLEIENPSNQCVFLGQGKSPFTVTFFEEDNKLISDTEALLKYTHTDFSYQFIYCFGDTFVKDFNDENVLFCAVDTKDYRSFETTGKGQIEKGDCLYRLLKAGSIIICKNSAEWINANENKNAETIGFNTFVTIGGNVK